MNKKWWHDKVAYQIYPKSFKDTNGDGIGDLRGIISKLDYLKNLGIDIIWISPIYKSPFWDQGYDISDYYAIAEEFGTMAEFDELLAEAKKREMYIVMDLVVNHCSSEHELFKKAMAEPDGEYGDYFYIREGKNGQPPNNARSYFGGSCWEPVPNYPNKYYLHMFAVQQPDLNWENKIVRERIYKMINWWLDKGVAGFRIDAIVNIKKNLAFPMLESDAADGTGFCTKMLGSPEEFGAMLQELKRETFDKYEAFTVGELFDVDDDIVPKFIGENGYFSTIFDFTVQELYASVNGWYDVPKISFKNICKSMIDSQLLMQNHGFEANIIENHDEPRGVSRYLPEYAQNPAGTKMLGTISILLRGIPFIYQGQEIGMQNAAWQSIDEFNDISTKDQYNVALAAGLTAEEALKAVTAQSRDNGRTPMQWSDEENAGFSTGKPWLKINSNYQNINVAAQEKDSDSVLNYYKKLIALRKSDKFKEIFTYGTIQPQFSNVENIMAYSRKYNDTEIYVIANYGKDDIKISLPNNSSTILISNMNRTVVEKDIVMKSCEVVVLEIR